MRNKLFTVLLLASSVAIAAPLPREEAVPGGIALVEIGPLSTTPPEVRYEGKRVMVQASAERWWAIVGLPLDTPVGTQRIVVNEQKQASRELSFTTIDKHYTEQRLTLQNKRMVDPNPQDLKRISHEQQLSRAAFATWRQQQEVPMLFTLPAEGRLSSPFGLRRFFNDQPRAPHSGIDIAAPLGAKVHAPAAGVVIEVGDYFFNGKSVFIDHGQGLVTMYCHLDTIGVKKGQQLTQGELFATVGKSGRATGPHLHWSVSLNEARIDPLLLLAPELVASLTLPANP